MTFSIVAHCPRTGQVGVAAMTAMVGVGKLVGHTRAGRGAAASQALVNPYLALDGLRMLDEGHSAQEACDHLIAADPGAPGRQMGIVDVQGGAAAFTGTAPDDWKGHRTGVTDGGAWAVQGNRLAGAEVLERTLAAFLDRPDRDLVHRFLAAIEAGEAAGGDTKGHHSATISIVDTEEYPLWDVRVDFADDPVAELHRHVEVFEEELIHQIAKMPTRANPKGDFDIGV